MLKMVLITKENVNEALAVFHRIFSWIPKEADPYTGVLNGQMAETKARYYMVYDGENIVGITGFYIVPEDPESAFLGWFGVVPEMRRYHYGSKIIRLHEEELRRLGYKYSRLYTEAENNDATRGFYERNGYEAEAYDCPKEPARMKGVIVTYSKSLGDWPLIPWNSRYMNLAGEAKMMYTEEQLKNMDALMAAMKAAEHA